LELKEVQSSSQIVTANTQLSTGRMSFLSSNQQRQSRDLLLPHDSGKTATRLYVERELQGRVEPQSLAV